ncbi:MAG: hypothetical protein AUJ18_02100 [Candidatus Hydrogenedentes bacterium CG1_02_42_14]|nr:MAG: hypothetical protein AUJ18_02100 [Candidatus Hydrogenedentes bacterium CG1_02_42_14]
MCRFFSYFHSFSHFISFLFFLEAVKNQKENPPAFIPQTPFCGRTKFKNKLVSVLPKLFSGERIWQNFSSFVFEFGSRKWKRRGLGRNFPFAPLFSFGEFRAGRKLCF